MNTKAKPFIKWVGGKGQLIEQLEAKLPADFDNKDDCNIKDEIIDISKHIKEKLISDNHG